jgi:hypothetical protein
VKVKQKYRNTLAHYLEWITDDFLRPKFKYDGGGLSAAEIMLRWETYGEALPESSSEPDLLAKYVQGKTSRDFYIKNWKEDVKNGWLHPEELLYTLGFNEVEFRSVFGRDPDPLILIEFKTVDEFLRLTEGNTDGHIGFLRACMLRVKEKEMAVSGHFIEKCSCGEVITQCRCMAPDKKVIVTPNGCAKCKAEHDEPRDMTDNLNFKPSDVDLSNDLCSTFGKCEVETAAAHLIEYLRENGDTWHFKFSGLYVYYYNHQLNSDEMLFGLLGPWFDDGGLMSFRKDGFYIVNWGSGLQVTENFLKRIAKHVHIAT